jgi:hypothetical protein
MPSASASHLTIDLLVSVTSLVILRSLSVSSFSIRLDSLSSRKAPVGNNSFVKLINILVFNDFIEFTIRVISMPDANVETRFEPITLKANNRNEALMYILVSAKSPSKLYWCECDILVSPPLSLAHDKELNVGRSRVGILKPNGKIEKQIKLYTRPNNFPDSYPVKITTYLYDEDGAIVERLEQNENIKCEA